MNKKQALKELETMSDTDFNNFLTSLPPRVQLLIRGGMVQWREVLPEWYMNTITEGTNNMYRYIVDLKLTEVTGVQRVISVITKAHTEHKAMEKAEKKAQTIEGVAFIKAVNAFYMGVA